jgi:hypothetical protein
MFNIEVSDFLMYTVYMHENVDILMNFKQR